MVAIVVVIPHWVSLRNPYKILVAKTLITTSSENANNIP
jgi:hypothetical protein